MSYIQPFLVACLCLFGLGLSADEIPANLRKGKQIVSIPEKGYETAFHLSRLAHRIVLKDSGKLYYGENYFVNEMGKEINHRTQIWRTSNDQLTNLKRFFRATELSNGNRFVELAVIERAIFALDDQGRVFQISPYVMKVENRGRLLSLPQIHLLDFVRWGSLSLPINGIEVLRDGSNGFRSTEQITDILVEVTIPNSNDRLVPPSKQMVSLRLALMTGTCETLLRNQEFGLDHHPEMLTSR